MVYNLWQMYLVDAIREDLIDTTTTLAQALLKTKVLAKRIGNDNLFAWADKEVIGIPTGEAVPSYRLVPMKFSCSILQNGELFNNEPLPIAYIDDRFLQVLLYHAATEGVQTLEEKACGKHGSEFSKTIGPDMCAFVNTRLKRDTPISIYTITSQYHISDLTQVLTVIRSKLLDFILEVESQLPDLDEKIKQKISLNKEEKTEVERIVYNTVIKAGSNNTIVAGDGNSIWPEPAK